MATTLDPRCPAGEDGFPDCNVDGSGVCLWCDYASCTACGAPVAAIEAKRLHWVPGECAPGILCLGCTAEPDVDAYGNVLVEDDGSDDPPGLGPYESEDAVPVAIKDEETGEQTVRIQDEPTGTLAADWFEKLDGRAAA